MGKACHGLGGGDAGMGARGGRSGCTLDVRSTSARARARNATEQTLTSFLCSVVMVLSGW